MIAIAAVRSQPPFKSVTTMTNIPLLCNICPKEPEFSDVSHLLTHVASKGHLSQYNKAKLRSRQDALYREKLEAYDDWYQRYQIERLLSERMMAKDSKDSKDSSSRGRATRINSRSSASTKKPAPRQKRIKKVDRREEGISPIKSEGAIDPQLSYLDQYADTSNRSIPSIEPPLAGGDGDQIAPTLTITPPHFHQSAFSDQRYRRSQRAPIPHMSTWQSETYNPHNGLPQTLVNGIGNQTPMQNDDSGGESDYFQQFLRSPSKTAYPDPSEVIGLNSVFSVGSSSPLIKEDDMRQSNASNDIKDEISKRTKSASQSPVLRGVKWPGMSIFDSANVEAQRLRNQKKTDSVVEQMEHNSTIVEQTERIYWPDGSLKMQRLITGEVESSPPRDLTPPPRPSKRRRTKMTKSILTDISVNASRIGTKVRNRKTPGRLPVSHASDLQSVSQKALDSLDPPLPTHPRNSHVLFNAHKEDEYERGLKSRLSVAERHKKFKVFEDSEEPHVEASSESTPNLQSKSFRQTSHGHHHGIKVNGTSPNTKRGQYPLVGSRAAMRLASPNQENTWKSQLRDCTTTHRPPLIDIDSENIEPLLDNNGRIRDEPAFTGHGRVTQRYFSVTGNQPPQFFNSMPPGMDFGGTTEKRYYGSTLNPLSSYLRQQSPAATQFLQSRSPSSRSNSNVQSVVRPGLGGARTSSKASEQPR